MTLSELFVEIGDDNLKFQILSQVLDGNQTTVSAKRGGGTRLSFICDEPLIDIAAPFGGETKKEAFVVWVDRADMNAAVARLKARRGGEEKKPDNADAPSHPGD